ncbi:MAG: hypothetical protein QOC66_4126, partial [Pseudonocardiales bacterium]|nr:hypothetical protein [Pseudonocardiales bacterium]
MNTSRRRTEYATDEHTRRWTTVWEQTTMSTWRRRRRFNRAARADARYHTTGDALSNVDVARDGGRRSNRIAILIAAASFVATVAAVPAAATAATPFRAVVTLSPTTSTLGAKVTAAVSHSTKPAGDALRSIRLNWGDGTTTVTLASLSSRPTHHYGHPGAFTVHLTLVDQHGNVAHGSAVEHVTVPAGSYTGLSPQSGLHFYVGFSHATVQDASASLWESCSDNS